MATVNLTPVLPALVTGLVIQSGIKTATLSWNAIEGMTYQVWMALTDNVQASVLVGSVESNSFAATGLTQSAFFYVRAINEFGVYGPTTAGVQYVPQAITTADVSQVAAPGAYGLSVTASSSSPTATNYEQWYASGSAAFTPSDDSIIQASIYQISTITNVSASFGNLVEVWARTRLYDNTLGADVPAGTKKWLLYQNGLGISAYGNLVNLLNLHETYVTGFRGLLVPGHDYTLYVEAMKHKTGTGACDLKINSGSVELTGASFN